MPVVSPEKRGSAKKILTLLAEKARLFQPGQSVDVGWINDQPASIF